MRATFKRILDSGRWLAGKAIAGLHKLVDTTKLIVLIIHIVGLLAVLLHAAEATVTVQIGG